MWRNKSVQHRAFDKNRTSLTSVSHQSTRRLNSNSHDPEIHRDVTFCRSIESGIGTDIGSSKYEERRSQRRLLANDRSVQTDDAIFGDWLEGVRKRQNAFRYTDEATIATLNSASPTAAKRTSLLVNDISTLSKRASDSCLGRINKSMTRELEEHSPLLGATDTRHDEDDNSSSEDDNAQSTIDDIYCDDDICDVLSTACSVSDLTASFSSLLDLDNGKTRQKRPNEPQSTTTLSVNKQTPDHFKRICELQQSDYNVSALTRTSSTAAAVAVVAPAAVAVANKGGSKKTTGSNSHRQEEQLSPSRNRYDHDRHNDDRRAKKKQSLSGERTKPFSNQQHGIEEMALSSQPSTEYNQQHNVLSHSSCPSTADNRKMTDQLTKYSQSTIEKDTCVELKDSPSSRIGGLQQYLSKRGIEIDVATVKSSDV